MTFMLRLLFLVAVECTLSACVGVLNIDVSIASLFSLT